MVEYIEYFGVALFVVSYLAFDTTIAPIVIGVALTISMLSAIQINL